jgi:hypothetical protein
MTTAVQNIQDCSLVFTRTQGAMRLRPEQIRVTLRGLEPLEKKQKSYPLQAFKILGPAERVYHLLENLGRLRVLREAPLSMYPPLLFSSSSSLDSSLLHLDPPLPAAPSPTEDFLPKLQIRETTWLIFKHFILFTNV